MIMNTAKSVIRRALQVSHASFHKDIEEDLKIILLKNGFPEKTISKLIHQVKNSPTRNGSNAHTSYPFLNNTTIPASITVLF